MFVCYRTLGLIVEKENRGEADLLLTIFTKDFGKMEILGKAGRKISSKLRPAVEIFSLAEIEFVQGKFQKILTDAILVEKFSDIKNNLDKLRVAYQISETLGRLIKGQEKDGQIWRLLTEAFKKLHDYQLPDYQLLYYFFLWNFFSALGYQPDMEKLELKIANYPATKILKLIAGKNWEGLLKSNIDKNVLGELRTISEEYYFAL